MKNLCGQSNYWMQLWHHGTMMCPYHEPYLKLAPMVSPWPMWLPTEQEVGIVARMSRQQGLAYEPE